MELDLGVSLIVPPVMVKSFAKITVRSFRTNNTHKNNWAHVCRMIRSVLVHCCKTEPRMKVTLS